VTVLDWAPDLADAVVAGAQPLSKAIETARERKTAATSTEALIVKLRAETPDLADLVTEERMSLAEAGAAARERAAARTRDIQAARRAAESLVGNARADAAAIAIGADLGEEGLVTGDMVDGLAEVMDLLKGLL